MSLPRFGELVGISYVTIWKIEIKENLKLQPSTIEALAPVLGYSVNELIAICTGKLAAQTSDAQPVPPCREFLIAEQVLPIIQQLPTEEKRRLREIDLDTMSNRDFAEAMEAMARAYRRRAGL